MRDATSTTASISASTCSTVFDRPSEKRTLDRACSSGQPDRRQHMRWLRRAARTRRAARYRESLEVERDQQRLAIDAVEANVGSVARRAARPRRSRACPERDREFPAPDDRAARPGATASASPCFDDPLRRASQAHRARDVLRARAHARAHVRPPYSSGRSVRSLADVQRARRPSVRRSCAR